MTEIQREAWLNRLATAVPGHDIHHAFIDWAIPRIADQRQRALFARMARRSGIDHRWSVLPPTAQGGSPVASGGFYENPTLPTTTARMKLYANYAPQLALQAVAALGEDCDPKKITHIIVASCTGFVAPGIDQIIAQEMGLNASVERILIGFMGCYAGVTALRTARHIVRSDPDAVVLMISVELSTLHLQLSNDPEPLLAMLQFSDGAAAAIISAQCQGIRLGPGTSMALEHSADLIRWDIGETGFSMQLSGAVPARIKQALGTAEARDRLFPKWPVLPPLLAVHAGGRSVLDAVQQGLEAEPAALADSRDVLAAYGNMSSATILFVLARMMERGARGDGVAIAFGPGLAAEAIAFCAP